MKNTWSTINCWYAKTEFSLTFSCPYTQSKALEDFKFDFNSDLAKRCGMHETSELLCDFEINSKSSVSLERYKKLKVKSLRGAYL